MVRIFSKVLGSVLLVAVSSVSHGEANFVYGADCSLLAQMSHAELEATLHPRNGENFDRFCLARGVYSCADYTSLLDGLGELEDNGIWGCRFISSGSTP